jgi:glucose-1-phosphate cytidylyltransferase
MIDIGGRPLLWHVMKSISRAGINNFIVCTGYRGYVIREYFANYVLHTSDVTFDLKNQSFSIHRCSSEPWKVSVIDTGENTMTGGRLKRVLSYLGTEPFLFTYGDGVADVDLEELFRIHNQRGYAATVTAIRPPGRFGALEIEADRALRFTEKPAGDGGWINGGYFVLDPKVGTYLLNDETIWEQEPLRRLAEDRELGVYRHCGIWQSVDTLRDKNQLIELWESGKLPWSIGTP